MLQLGEKNKRSESTWCPDPLTHSNALSGDGLSLGISVRIGIRVAVRVRIGIRVAVIVRTRLVPLSGYSYD